MIGTKDDSKLLICRIGKCYLKEPNGTTTIPTPNNITMVSFYGNNEGFVGNPRG